MHCIIHYTILQVPLMKRSWEVCKADVQFMQILFITKYAQVLYSYPCLQNSRTRMLGYTRSVLCQTFIFRPLTIRQRMLSIVQSEGTIMNCNHKLVQSIHTGLKGDSIPQEHSEIHATGGPKMFSSAERYHTHRSAPYPGQTQIENI